MSLKIGNKLLVILLVLTILPLSVLGYLAFNDIQGMGFASMSDVNSIGDIAIADSTASLNSLGETIIKEKAIDVAKQLEIYIKSHPTMTVEDLQADEYFQSIAVQPVGDTGYTAVTDVDSLTARFHTSEKVVNLDLHVLAEKLPGFWGVMSQSEGGNEVFGYYDWAEADGSINQKYMYIALVDAKTADGVTLSVAATTYIDEFNAPVKATEEKIGKSVNDISNNIEQATAAVKSKTGFFIILIVVLALLVSILFAHSLTKPLKDLTDAAKKVADGDFDVKIPEVKGKDEVSDLTAAMEMLVAGLKAKMKKK